MNFYAPVFKTLKRFTEANTISQLVLVMRRVLQMLTGLNHIL